MRFLKYFFGWLGVLVDIGCLLIVALLLWTMYQPGGEAAAWALVFGGPILLGIMLVATIVSIGCFMSLHRARSARGESPGFDERHIAVGIDGQRHYAGFWVRFCAVLVDILVLIIPCYFLLDLFVGSFLASLVIPWLYTTLMMHSAKQATLGMMAFGLRTVDARGNRLSIGRATGRYFGSIVSGLLLGIGYLLLLRSKQKQTLHDRMAGTFIVYGR
jgi:uncharacterized RDD family membrane protein YckC